VNQSDGVSEYPSDWNCHPDTNLTDIVGEEIGEGNACSQGYHGQDNGHAGFFDCAVISVQKEKASYSAVKRSLYAEILYTTGDDDSGNILCDDSCKCCTADANVYNFKISTNLKAKKNDIWLICFCTQCYTSNRKK